MKQQGDAAKADTGQFEKRLREQALELGFDRFGIARIENIPAMAHYAAWINKGYHATMEYLARHEEKKCNPELIVENANSIFVCAKNYNAPQPKSTEPAKPDRAWISRYAWGDDYHEIIKKNIVELNNYWLNLCERRFSGRYYIDTGPVFERAWAERAGIGWSGKNCCIINRELGSWLFLAVIITDAEFQPSPPVQDFCGSCTACIDACPTNALRAPYVLDSNRCISYHTIENKGDIPDHLQMHFGRQIFGCDICQDVCPWNKKAAESSDRTFQPRENLMNPDLAFLLQLDEEKFHQLFRKSPVKRTKFRGFMRNVLIAASNSGNSRLTGLVEKFTGHEERLIREQAVLTKKRLTKHEKMRDR